jgi:hypothetical protein
VVRRWRRERMDASYPFLKNVNQLLSLNILSLVKNKTEWYALKGHQLLAQGK